MSTSSTETKTDKGAVQAASAESSAYHPLAGMRDEMDRTLARIFGGDLFGAMPRLGRLWDMPALSDEARRTFASMAGIPKADLTEDDKQFELTVELPGMDEKDLDLTLGDGVLILKGEKKHEKETKEKDFHITERSYGAVQRRFALPPGVDMAKLDASFSKGVLKVVLPKTTEARSQTRKIKVKSA